MGKEVTEGALEVGMDVHRGWQQDCVRTRGRAHSKREAMRSCAAHNPHSPSQPVLVVLVRVKGKSEMSF